LQRAGLDTDYESVPRTANESLCSAIPSIQPSGEVELGRKVRLALYIHFRARLSRTRCLRCSHTVLGLPQCVHPHRRCAYSLSNSQVTSWRLRPYSAHQTTAAINTPSSRLLLSVIANTTGSSCISPRLASIHTRLSHSSITGTTSQSRAMCW